MNIRRMTEKQILQAIKEPLPKECKYGSIEELLFWTCNDHNTRQSCEIELPELYSFGDIYHKLTGKQKAVYNALATGVLEFDYGLIEDGEFTPLLVSAKGKNIKGRHHGN